MRRSAWLIALCLSCALLYAEEPALISPQEVQARTVKKVPPKYPAAAQEQGIAGVVTVRVVVGKDGVPKSAKALDGPPLLFDAATDAAKEFRFRPIKKGGRPSEFQCHLTFTFSLTGG